MVKHWREVRESGWQWRLAVNAFGGVLTAVVLGIVVFEKFRDGAYLVVILVPLLVAMMLFINRQYARSKKELAVRPDLIVGPPIREERVVVPIPGLDRATVQAIKVGRSIDEDVRAVFISDDPSARRRSAVTSNGRSRRAAGGRRVSVSGTGGASPGIPRRARYGLATGQAGAHHVRRHTRIRREELVGTAALQPVGEAAPFLAARSTAHRSS
jgi:hypothetical protein